MVPLFFSSGKCPGQGPLSLVYVVLTTFFLCLFNRSLKLKRSHLARKTVTNLDQSCLGRPACGRSAISILQPRRQPPQHRYAPCRCRHPQHHFLLLQHFQIHRKLIRTAKRVPGKIKPYVVSDGVPDGYVFSGKPHEEINFYIAAVEQSLKGVLKAAEADTGRRIGCVMSDAFLWFACDLAEEMGVPWVPFWCAGANSSCATHFYTDLIMNTVGMHDTVGRENAVLNFVPGFPELRVGNLPPGILISNSEPPFVTMLHKMGQALHKATAVFLNSFEEIDPEINPDLKSKLKMFLNVGPSNLLSSSPLPPSSYSDEYGCIPWLDNFKAASVAYIGFGTMLSPSPPEIVELAEALEASGTPFLWSLKDNMKEFLPHGFMERTSKLGKIVPWAPQQQILAHSSIGVSVTHCGWNSVLESIVAGVPLIENGWMMENVWKIGVRLEGGVFTKNGTMLALELVLNHEKGKEMRKQIGKYKELAWKAVGPEGSSTQNFNTLLEVVTG